MLFFNSEKRKIQDVLEYLQSSDERAEEREERMLQQMQQTVQTNTSLLGLVERMVSAIEGVSNPQGQNRDG